MSCFLLCGFSCFLPFIHPRCDKLTVVYLFFSKFNSSQMLEFDDSWELITTRILSGIIPDEKHFTNFLSSFCFSIAPGNSNTSILITLTSLSLFSYQLEDLSFLFLISQTLSSKNSITRIPDKPQCYVWQCYI